MTGNTSTAFLKKYNDWRPGPRSVSLLGLSSGARWGLTNQHYFPWFSASTGTIETFIIFFRFSMQKVNEPPGKTKRQAPHNAGNRITGLTPGHHSRNNYSSARSRVPDPGCRPRTQMPWRGIHRHWSGQKLSSPPVGRRDMSPACQPWRWAASSGDCSVGRWNESWRCWQHLGEPKRMAHDRW